jgi:hypothetical protein
MLTDYAHDRTTIVIEMRTTLNIDDDVLRAARSLAASQGKSIGEVISSLVRRSLSPGAVVRRQGFPMFQVEEGAPPITSEMVRQARDDEG